MTFHNFPSSMFCYVCCSRAHITYIGLIINIYISNCAILYFEDSKRWWSFSSRGVASLELLFKDWITQTQRWCNFLDQQQNLSCFLLKYIFKLARCSQNVNGCKNKNLMETMQFLFNNKQNRQLIILPLLLAYKGPLQLNRPHSLYCSYLWPHLNQTQVDKSHFACLFHNYCSSYLGFHCQFYFPKKSINSKKFSSF